MRKYPDILSLSKKECPKCGGIFSTDNFFSDKRESDGYSKYCKSCMKSQQQITGGKENYYKHEYTRRLQELVDLKLEHEKLKKNHEILLASLNSKESPDMMRFFYRNKALILDNVEYKIVSYLIDRNGQVEIKHYEFYEKLGCSLRTYYRARNRLLKKGIIACYNEEKCKTLFKLNYLILDKL
jgi:hypothetical protein